MSDDAISIARDGSPQIKWMIRRLIEDFSGRVTLLAVCPNSEAVTRAALEVSREANTPMLFAATLNQVDREGSYTGWTPQTFTRFLREESDRIGLEHPPLPCLDHGGPWLKDHHTTAGFSLDETMAEVRKSIEACLEAGYALLHIDPTVDRTLPEGGAIPVELVVERTLDLVAHAESHRTRSGLPPVSYEVGTEEVHGGLADLSVFDAFLAGLDAGLRDRGLEEAWPCFVVGKVGTDLDTTYFDPEVASNLTQRVKRFGALIKGHYSDYVENPHEYPLSHMGGANVGPEFTEEEFLALENVVLLESLLGKRSGFETALRQAVVDSGRWMKWLKPDERGLPFDALSEERKRWLLRTCSRYIWTDPSVQSARVDLYYNVRDHRDADRFVIWWIKKAIMKYVHAFNLVDFLDRLEVTHPAARDEPVGA